MSHACVPLRGPAANNAAVLVLPAANRSVDWRYVLQIMQWVWFGPLQTLHLIWAPMQKFSGFEVITGKADLPSLTKHLIIHYQSFPRPLLGIIHFISFKVPSQQPIQLHFIHSMYKLLVSTLPLPCQGSPHLSKVILFYLPTDQRGGKMTKSAMAVPGFREGQVSTVKMLGSMWSKLKIKTKQLLHIVLQQRKKKQLFIALFVMWIGFLGDHIQIQRMQLEREGVSSSLTAAADSFNR